MLEFTTVSLSAFRSYPCYFYNTVLHFFDDSLRRQPFLEISLARVQWLELETVHTSYFEPTYQLRQNLLVFFVGQFYRQDL